MSKKEFPIKVCLFGNSGVGKTTLSKRYLTGLFESNIIKSIGTEIFVKRFDFKNYEIILQIWDFAGEEQFHFLLPAYSAGSDAGIFMFDITSKDSLKNFYEWLKLFKVNLIGGERAAPVIIVGGKLDLDAEREVSRDDVLEIIGSTAIVDYIECTSKTGHNVEIIFEVLTKEIINQYVKE